MVFRIAMFALVGGIAGEGMRRLAIRLIKNRTEQQPVTAPFLTGKWSPLAWIAICAAWSAIIALIVSDVFVSAEYTVVFLILSSLAATDIVIRRIPNELLVVLLGLKLISILIMGNIALLLPAAGGMIVGLILFSIPSMLGLGIGTGDVKLAGVAGFCLGIVGIFQASLMMAMVMAIIYLYLKITKRGDLKTKIAIGPPLSFGLLTTLLFPLAIAL